MGLLPDALATQVVKTLRERGATLATSESLTGGLIGATITEVPGASEVYLGGAIAYDVMMKARLSGVSRTILHTYGVVSEQTVTEMAVGIQTLTGSTWAIAASGVAGPAPQQGHAPGEVWIGLAGPQLGQHHFLLARRHQFTGDRSAVRQQTVATSLQMLLTALSPV
ncbi:MAG: CinA family protein [Propionicimonas sp.]